MGRLQGKSAVITGGASGIGMAAAQMFAAEGAAVAIADLDQQQASDAAARIQEAGGRAIGIAVDVMDEESLAALVNAAVQECGRLDIMCNHVGGSNPRKDLDMLRLDLEEFDRTMQLNVRSALLGCRLALPHL